MESASAARYAGRLGTGSQNTPTFDAAADWIVSWEHKGSRRAKSAVLIMGPIREVFALSIYREGARDASDVHAVACPPSGPERGEFRVKEAGRFYLGIVAIHDVRWTVKVAPAPRKDRSTHALAAEMRR